MTVASRLAVRLGTRPLLVHNSLTRTLEPLSHSPHSPLLWYSCGPTVYADAHLGHARAYVSFDIIRRLLLTHARTPVRYAFGITDVDDKIIARAAEMEIAPADLAERYEDRFSHDMASLGVLPPSDVLRVTEHIPELTEFVARLVENGRAYVVEGSVYFDVAGAGYRYAQLEPSRAVKSSVVGEGGKRDGRDFALWKGGEGTASWGSPWGRGRPGWHVECSAMATAALGDRLDLHTGGVDLRFPHHTNELATAEAALCCGGGDDRWVQTWMHAGHLGIRGRKMSKSLKNFVSVREFLQRGGDADAFRVYCLMHKYSAPLDFALERVSEAASYLSRVRGFIDGVRVFGEAAAAPPLSGKARPSLRAGCDSAARVRAALAKFHSEAVNALKNDFDTPVVLTAMSALMTAVNKELSISGGSSASASAAVSSLDAAFAMTQFLEDVGVSARAPHAQSESNNDSVLDELVYFREQVRQFTKKKDFLSVFKACDDIREKLSTGFHVKIADQPDGDRWRRI